VDPDSELLSLLDSDLKVLVAGNEDRVADGSISCKCNHIGHDQRIHALLLADAANETESDLDVLQMSERKMLRRGTR